VQQGFAAEAAMASRAFRPAHEHEWFNQSDTMYLKEFAQVAQLSFGIVKHFSSRRIVDADLTWLVGKLPQPFHSDLSFLIIALCRLS
jgi:hypothetical protein